MSRKRTIALAGAALLATLALIERATNSVELVPANVIGLQQGIPNEGPNRWIAAFELTTSEIRGDKAFNITEDGTAPLLAYGDPICLRLHRRGWAAPKFQIVSDKSCWDGVDMPAWTIE
ncbi:hypothetical protein [uncultured Sulfitobacter sp.]|uniref:hypothetical protein n=1 Tax=uncultured Sulfitobacter sp. TaxID=191468 RepID=UPI0026386E29|nr:hypothetical protein [uncultured Sulfitobacter sp.]